MGTYCPLRRTYATGALAGGFVVGDATVSSVPVTTGRAVTADSDHIAPMQA
jgi:hypothetical protein